MLSGCRDLHAGPCMDTIIENTRGNHAALGKNIQHLYCQIGELSGNDFQNTDGIGITSGDRNEDRCDYTGACAGGNRNGYDTWNDCGLFPGTMGGEAVTTYGNAQRLK